jgi:transposase
LRQPDRQQILAALPLEDLLDTDHQARLVWDFCLGLDLQPLGESIRSRQAGPGRAAIDPRLCVALWLYATLEGVGPARALAWLCSSHNAFRWLCGGVSVNHHTLSDFRVGHVEMLDQRLRQALGRLPELEARKRAGEKDKARAPGADPEATVMKMADGGYRPAYNVEYSAGTASLAIVAVAVATSGSDAGQITPLNDQIHDRHGAYPQEALADGGFVSLEDIETAQAPPRGTRVYAPVPQPKDPQRDRHAPPPGGGAQVGEWRARMGTEPAKAVYRQRASTAECVNAQARNRGLIRLLVRGLRKVTAVALWFAIAHNAACGLRLRAAAGGTKGNEGGKRA